MRSCVFLAALLVGAAIASPARSGPIFTFGGVDPTNLTFKPIDPAASVVPIAQPMTRSTTGFKLINLLPHISFPGAKPVVGMSQFPAQGMLPGANYLKAFRIQQLGPAQ
jgi:hypothetical protein